MKVGEFRRIFGLGMATGCIVYPFLYRVLVDFNLIAEDPIPFHFLLLLGILGVTLSHRWRK